MTRIFTTLSIVALALLATNFYLGWTGGDYNAISQELRQQQERLSRLRSTAVTDSQSLLAAQDELGDILNRVGGFQRRTRRHMLVGVLTALVTVMVNSISVTYFIGTSRWCKEVCDTYHLDPQYVDRANRLKRRTFPWSLLGILTVLAIAALGAASDPGTLRDDTQRWVAPHFLAAITGGLVIAWALWSQFRNIQRNYMIIDEILADVRRIRQAKGLEVEVPPRDQTAELSQSE